MHTTLAAIFASVIATASLHWMETMKYRRQLKDDKPILAHGFLALQHGLLLNLVANTVAWTLSLGLKTFLQTRIPYLTALCVAIVISTIATNGLWVAKTHIQTSLGNRIEWKPAWFYRGLSYSIIINLLYGGINYILYDVLYDFTGSAATSGAISKVISLVATYNLQHHRFQSQVERETHYAGLRWAMTRSILHNMVLFYLYQMLASN